nr:hypothetical protein [Tanacetum cinerariifolium]
MIHTILQCLSAKTTSCNEFSSTMASAIICLATNQKFNFSRYILLSLVKNIEAGVPFFMFPMFVQLIINHQLGDMTYHKGIFATPSLTKKVFANMKRVGIRFSREVTTLFDNMLKHKPKRKHTKEPEVPPTESQVKHNVPLPYPSHDPLPTGEDSQKLKELMDLCTNLSNKVLDFESEVLNIKSTYKAKIEKLKSMVERNHPNRRGKIADIVADVEINLEKVQAEAYNLDLGHQEKVLSMLDVNNEEPTDVEEVLEVVKAAKLITKVVTTAGVDRRGVIIQDLEKTTTTVTVQPRVQSKDKEKAILIKEPKPLKMQVQIDLDEEVTRQLEVELSADINWNAVIKQIPIVDYKIHTERNRPYFKIIRADGNHRLFLSFSTMLKNFDREDLESLWKIVKERFKKIEPKNYTDDYLLNTLKIMFAKHNVEANVWKDQKGKYNISTVERMYPLTHFTLEQMVNNVRLEVDDESEMSLKLLRLVRRQLNEGYVPQ